MDWPTPVIDGNPVTPEADETPLTVEDLSAAYRHSLRVAAELRAENARLRELAAACDRPCCRQVQLPWDVEQGK